MSQRPWIETVPDDRADGLLARIYEAARGRAGKVFNIVRLTSLRPNQTRASMGFYREIMMGESELGRDERELIATVVSHANDCFY